jgi:hypothetical protein
MENKNLTRENMQYLLDNKNEGNRPMSSVKIRKYVKLIKEGEWNNDFDEGKTIILDTEGFILSAQHRLQAMLDAGVESWNVNISKVARGWWLLHTQESRTGGDRAVMLAGSISIDKKLAVYLEHLSQQDAYITDAIYPHLHTSGNAQCLDDKKETYLKYQGKVEELLYNLDSIKFKTSVMVKKSLCVLYAHEYITLSDLPLIKENINEMVIHAKSINCNRHHFIAHMIVQLVYGKCFKKDLPKSTIYNGNKASPLIL